MRQDQSVIGKLRASGLNCSELLLGDVASCWVHVPLCVCEFLALVTNLTSHPILVSPRNIQPSPLSLKEK